MKKLFFLFTLFSLSIQAQHTLSITVNGVSSSRGKISIAIYDNADGFLKFDGVFKSGAVAAKEGTTALTIANIPDGVFAVAVFHDANGNEELDTNWLGIPKEDVGFSNAKMKTFGPPSFRECSFDIRKNHHIVISI